MEASTQSRIPDHVPASLVVDGNPWQGGDVPPHEWLERIAAGGGLRYALHGPLPQDDNQGCWITTEAKAIRSILIDHRNFVSKDSTGVGKLLGEGLVLAPLESDAPDHQTLRGILQPWFQPAAVKARQERIDKLSRDLIEGFADRGSCEFVSEFAVRLPTQIFVELMGLPVEDLPQLLEWEDIAMGRKGADLLAETWLKIRGYMAAAIADRRRAPRDDLLSEIVLSTDARGVDPEGEALGMALILFAAGLDTVVTALGWHFMHLAEHQDEQARLRREPDLIPAAIEELLRLYSFTALTRTAVRDVEIGGVLIKAGERVVCPTALGSRDPTDYADPRASDFDRGARRHLAFGFGQHICIGMHLARLELIGAMRAWLAAIPQFRTPEGYRPPWHGGISFGLDELRLEWSPAKNIEHAEAEWLNEG